MSPCPCSWNFTIDWSHRLFIEYFIILLVACNVKDEQEAGDYHGRPSSRQCRTCTHFTWYTYTRVLTPVLHGCRLLGNNLFTWIHEPLVWSTKSTKRNLIVCSSIVVWTRRETLARLIKMINKIMCQHYVTDTTWIWILSLVIDTTWIFDSYLGHWYYMDMDS